MNSPSPPGSAQAQKDILPKGLAERVEAAVGAAIVGVRPRGGGGASREGAELTLAYPDGRRRLAYMNHDTEKAGAGDDASCLREAAILRALSGPLADSGVRAPKFIAAIPELRTLICEFTPGEADFNKLRTAEDRRATAHDFMSQLAALHAIDVAANPVDGMGPIVPASATVRETLQWLRARSLREGADPLILLTLDWLERNVPEDPDRTVIVHGDAGPANFLFEDNRVTALLDWELAQYGDPMADLAMICLRSLFQPFIPPHEAFAAYQAAGGVKVDLDRVRYYRAFFQVRFTHGISRVNNPALPAPASLGFSLVNSTIHRTVLCGAMAEMAGIELPEVPLPSLPPGPHQKSFDLVLSDLRNVIVPRLNDQQASAKAKSIARLVKWWRDLERYGPTFEALEIGELSRHFERPFASAAEGRELLCGAILEGAVAYEPALRLCHARAMRDHALLADAMGALADSAFAPLEQPRGP